MKKIICKISKADGGLTIKTDGFSGEECLKATEQLEKGLGMNAACELTEEYYKNLNTTEQQVGGDGNAS